jgi:hypothetical protein
MSGTFVPIFFNPGWLQERYQGWTAVHTGQRLKILKRRSHGLTKLLILSQGMNDREIEAAIGDRWGRLDIGVLHEFSGGTGERRILGRRFTPIPVSERMLNTATFAVDLGLAEDELFSRLGQSSRNMVRKAGSLGAKITFIETPTPADLSAFYELYLPLARRMGLVVPNRELLEAMFRGGNLLLALGRDQNGKSCLSNLVYLAEGQAYYLHGASAAQVPTGMGQFAHWETILDLKRRGLAWYDLGGVPPGDPKNGIYAFKASLGGDFVDLGAEFRFLPPWVKAPYLSFQRLRALWRKWK